VPLEPFLRPWTGEAVRHIPRNSPYDVLDFRFAGRSSGNRWNYPGEPTLYLARDRAVALAEFARHLAEDSVPGLVEAVIERSVFRLELAIDALLDLRDPQIHRELSLRGAPACFLDRAVARATAEYLRRTTGAQGLFVPSIAFLDDPTRWLLVLFLDKLPPEPEAFVRAVVSEGTFRVEEHGL
jgi:RES domain-containing protein